MSPSATSAEGGAQANGANVNRPLTRGIYVPTVAFFDETTEELDQKTTTKHAIRLAKAGVAGLAVQGSNGEAVNLTHEERNTITQATRAALDSAGFDKLPLIVGCGAQSTFEAVSLCKQAHAAGGDYALILPPSYYQGLFSPTTILDFFTDIADKSPIPVIIYNYPGATPGIDLNSDLLIALSKHANIAGCKFTCGNTGKLGRVSAAVRNSGTDFLCFAGSVDFTISSHSNGGAGVIGGLANVCPRANVKLFDLCEQGKKEEAQKLQDIIGQADWAAIQTGLLGVKAALREFYGYGGFARKPLPRPDEVMLKKVNEGMKAMFEVEQGLE